MLCYRDLFGSAKETTIRRIDSDDEEHPLPVKRAKVKTESPSDLLGQSVRFHRFLLSTIHLLWYFCFNVTCHAYFNVYFI